MITDVPFAQCPEGFFSQREIFQEKKNVEKINVQKFFAQNCAIYEMMW